MALPAGSIVEQGLVLANTNIRSKVASLVNEGFTGYLAVTIEGATGMEEGSLILEKGTVVGSTYELMNEDRFFYGEEALHKTLNALAARYGVVDISQLSHQQLQLVLALEEKIKVPSKTKDISRSIPKSYSKEESKKEKGKGTGDLFKRLGLTELR